MKDLIFKGCCTAIVTPFDKKNKIDYEVFKKLIDFQLENQTNAIVFMGTTGEASTLSDKEKINIAKFAIKYVNGRVPVILGAGGNNTQEVIERSIDFANLGADALLQVTPYYNKCTQNGLISHYKEIAQNIPNTPIIIYNVPSRTGVNILPDTVFKLYDIDNIVGIKEASGNISQLTELLRILPSDFAVYSGDDPNIFTTLALGGMGVISVVSNILPRETANICLEFFKGNIEKSRQLQFKLLPIINKLFLEVNPIPVKRALEEMGYAVGMGRMPLSKMDDKNFDLLKNELQKFNLI